jgi:hypothetical protein
MSRSEEGENPDRVPLRYARRVTNLVIRDLDDNTVLIEAPASGLRFLAELILAQASFSKDCGWQMDARTKYFGKRSKGIYIHRLPCLEKPSTTRSKNRRTPAAASSRPRRLR